MQLQLEQACQVPDAKRAYMNADKSSKLNIASLTRLKFIAARRFEYALKNDVSLNRVITNKALCAIAIDCPLTSKGLASCQMKWGAIREHGAEVIEWVKEAIALPPDESIEYPLDYFLTKNSNHDRVRQLKYFLNKKALEHNIAPEFFTQKKILADYFSARKYGRVARLKQGWRAEILSDLN